MKQPELNHRLSSLDAAFLYLERKECPMHIASTSVFDGKVSYRDLVKHIEERLHLIPRYLQKVVPDPFNLGHPTWESAEDFDIKQHIIEIKSKKALTHEDLVKLAGETLTTVLDRNKPLWELHIIPNVEGGRSAMIAKVHHCMVDGISGVDLIKILFDISPNSPPPPPKPEPQAEKPQPDKTQQLFDSVIGVLQEGVNRMTELQGGLMYMAQALANPQTVGALPHISGVLPAISTPAPNLPFNGECSGERRLAWSEFSFAEARAIRANLGGSVNDVVLTILSETVARYVKFHKEKTDGQIVRFMVPVSLRQEEKRGALGNMISILPVEIPLDVDNLPKRIKIVNQKTAVMKAAKLAEGLGIFGALYGMLPAQMQSIIGSVAELPFPPFNMVATNVPGPQIPLYMCGKKMLAHYPYVPIGYRLGLGCAIFSYNQTLYFGLSSDAKAMKDVEKFKELLDETFADLKRAAGIETEAANAAGAEK
jgi:diacylglycerol O-acyltransferase / wax synthase